MTPLTKENPYHPIYYIRNKITINYTIFFIVYTRQKIAFI